MSKKKYLSVQDLALVLNCYAHDSQGGLYILDSLRLYEIERNEEGRHDFKPLLRPISDITDEEVFEVCQITKSLPFLGSCPKSKWTIKREKDYISVNCPKNDHSFVIYTRKDTGYGDINIYIDSELDQVNDISLIVKYYLSKHFDIFGWIDEGLAIDKTKITSTNLK